MKQLALALEQALVGRVLDQGVLERVRGVGRRAAAEDEFVVDQLLQGVFQFVVAERRDGGQQVLGEFAADAGAELGGPTTAIESTRLWRVSKIVGIAVVYAT